MPWNDFLKKHSISNFSLNVSTLAIRDEYDFQRNELIKFYALFCKKRVQIYLRILTDDLSTFILKSEKSLALSLSWCKSPLHNQAWRNIWGWLGFVLTNFCWKAISQSTVFGSAKVSKSWKQILKFSFELKNEWKYFLYFCPRLYKEVKSKKGCKRVEIKSSNQCFCSNKNLKMCFWD